MKLLTGLFRAARKRLMTTDNDMGMFRQKLDELVAQKDSLSDEEIAAKVEEIKGFTTDLPSDDDKAKLDRFLDDFKAVKEQDPAAAKEAASMVADLFEKLDTAAMQDVPGAEEPAAEAEEAVAEEAAAKEAEGEPLVEGAAPETEETEVATEKDVETPAEKAEGEPEDADPNAEYSLEEIYQFIKQRMSEDAAAECKDEAAKEKEEEKEEVVADHAPFIPVTLNNTNKTNGSLASMFAEIKGAH